MNKRALSILLRYGVPAVSFLAIVFAALAAKRFFDLTLDPTSLIIVVLIAASWYGGRGPGLLVALEYEIAIQYFAASQPLSLRFFILILNRLLITVSLVLFVSSRRRIQSQLQEQREWLRVSLSSIGDAVIATDLKGAVNFINPTAETLTGWTTQEATGRPLVEVFNIINEFTRQRVDDPVSKVLREGAVVGLANHTILTAKDGREIAIDDSGAPIRASGGRIIGVILVFRDVTERRRAEETRAALAAIVESSDDAIIGTSLDGVIRSWNKGAERVYGYSAEEVMGKPVSILSPESKPDDFLQIMERIRRGERIDHYETQRLSKEGELIDVSLTVSPILNANGEIIGVSKVARDITERIRLLQSEQQARVAAEQANRAKDEFLAVLSHELRSPLNAMTGWTRLLQEGNLDETQMQRAVEIIYRNVNLQKTLIEDLLDVSRIISGKMRLEKEMTSLLISVQSALEEARPAAERRQIRIESSFDLEADTILSDKHRLQQIVTNLLNNAIKFSSEGSTIRVSLERENDMAKLVVQDFGIGIRTDLLPHIFDRFRQADTSSKRKYGGLGLGLTIVKNLVELHGGTISAHSDGEDTGTIFTVRLPLASQSLLHGILQTSNVASGNDDQSSRPLEGLRILLVDDDTDALELMNFVLTAKGASLTGVPSVSAALQALESQRFELLISDLGMPGMDGYELIQQVRHTVDADKLPAIALTGFVSSDDRERVLEAGFQVHLPKPVDIEKLLSLILSLTKNQTTMDSKTFRNSSGSDFLPKR
jgi:PAS domain S-box-containing protein